MPLLHPQSFDEAFRSSRGSRPRSTNGNWRRFWRQGRVSLNDCRACRAPRHEVRQAGENYLRPHGRHGGDHQALSPVVLSRGAIHAGGPYYWPSIRIRAKAVATNVPPHGAFRGFGAPQSLFAMERHMDRIAEVVGLSPAEIRRRNFLKPGQTTTTGQTVNEEVDLSKLLDRALELSNYHAKKEQFAQENQQSKHKRGMGIAAF